jgi:hypothetical protein
MVCCATIATLSATFGNLVQSFKFMTGQVRYAGTVQVLKALFPCTVLTRYVNGTEALR